MFRNFASYIKIEKLIVFLFVFQAFFLVIRTLLLGADTSSGPIEIFIALLPEIIILLILSVSVPKINSQFRPSTFDYIVISYFITNVLIGIYLSMNVDISLHGFRLTYVPMLLYFIIRLNKEIKLSTVIDPLSKWYVVFAVLALLLYFVFTQLEYTFIKQANAKYTFYYIRRMGGLYLTPVLWGTFASAFAFYFYLKFAQSKTLFYLIAFEMLWFCLVLSVSRGAIIPFYAAVIIVTIIYKWYRAFITVGVVSSVIFLAFTFVDPMAKYLIGFVSSSSMETVHNFSSDETQELIEGGDTVSFAGIKNTRVRFWALSVKSFKNNPQGYGLGKSGHVARQYRQQLVEGKTASLYSTDGWYLKLANETGVWGLLSYFFLFAVHVSMCVKYLRKSPGIDFVFCLVLFGMAAVQNIMSNVLDFYSFAGFYWMLLAFTHNIMEAGEYDG